MKEMIGYSKRIYKDNKKGDIPHKREVVLFGYNSSRFDTNLIFNS
jgi:hypothetical protein